MQEDHNEHELFIKIGLGDEVAFNQLFLLYRERLFAFAWQLCHSAVEAEEIIQDIFLRVWHSRERLKEVSSPKSYLYTMTRNRVIDALTNIAKNEQLARQVWINLSAAENPTHEWLEAKESITLINEAIKKLPLRKQEIFKLSRQEGFNHQQIANHFNISVQTVKNSMTEILNYLRKTLSGNAHLLPVLLWVPLINSYL